MTKFKYSVEMLKNCTTIQKCGPPHEWPWSHPTSALQKTFITLQPLQRKIIYQVGDRNFAAVEVPGLTSIFGGKDVICIIIKIIIPRDLPESRLQKTKARDWFEGRKVNKRCIGRKLLTQDHTSDMAFQIITRVPLPLKLESCPGNLIPLKIKNKNKKN